MCSSQRNVKVRAQMMQLRRPDGRQQLEQLVPGVLRVRYNSTGLLPAALDGVKQFKEEQSKNRRLVCVEVVNVLTNHSKRIVIMVQALLWGNNSGSQFIYFFYFFIFPPGSQF